MTRLRAAVFGMLLLGLLSLGGCLPHEACGGACGDTPDPACVIDYETNTVPGWKR